MSEWLLKETKKMRVEPVKQPYSKQIFLPEPPEPFWTKWFEYLNCVRTNPKWVDKTPIVTTFLLEIANVGQLWRMWTQSTAAGQSIWSWLSVNIALWLWLNFYLVFNASNKFAIWGTRVGILLNAAVILTVAYFRYVVHNG